MKDILFIVGIILLFIVVMTLSLFDRIKTWSNVKNKGSFIKLLVLVLIMVLVIIGTIIIAYSLNILDNKLVYLIPAVIFILLINSKWFKDLLYFGKN